MEAVADLFKIDETARSSTRRLKKQATELHNLTAKTLYYYATKQDRPETCTTIAFLTTRVREADKDDWAKLVYMMKYFRGTKELPLILSANRRGTLKW